MQLKGIRPSNRLPVCAKRCCRTTVVVRAHGQYVLGPEDRPLKREYVEEIITFISADGVTRIPGRLIETVQDPEESLAKLRKFQMPTWEEQKLCIGACFQVAATNGVDPSRRINYVGFCQSVDLLAECVGDAVLKRGGDVMFHEKRLKSGLHQYLQLTVAMPLLWGLSPQLDYLSDAIETGGGIVDRIYKQWGMY